MSDSGIELEWWCILVVEQVCCETSYLSHISSQGYLRPWGTIDAGGIFNTPRCSYERDATQSWWSCWAWGLKTSVMDEKLCGIVSLVVGLAVLCMFVVRPDIHPNKASCNYVTQCVDLHQSYHITLTLWVRKNYPVGSEKQDECHYWTILDHSRMEVILKVVQHYFQTISIPSQDILQIQDTMGGHLSTQIHHSTSMRGVYFLRWTTKPGQCLSGSCMEWYMLLDLHGTWLLSDPCYIHWNLLQLWVTIMGDLHLDQLTTHPL